MDRKSLIFCLSVLAVLVLGTGVAVAVLYSDSGPDDDRKVSQVADQDRYELLPAVPSDAIAVACFSKVEKALPGIYDGMDLPSSVMKRRGVVSLHYSGGLVPLYVFEVQMDADALSDDAQALLDSLKENGLYAEPVPGRPMVVASGSETILRSSLRHVSKGISVMHAAGFDKASASVSGADILFFSNSHAGNLLPSVLVKKYSSYSGFISRIADWTVLDMKDARNHISLSGTAVYDGDPSEFMSVLASSEPAVSSVSSVLPSYARFVVSLPMGNVDGYVDAYMGYLDSRQSLQKTLANRKEIERNIGIEPVALMHQMDVREVATASFGVGSAVERVLLVRLGAKSFQLPSDTGRWPYPGAVASVFGGHFGLEDESCFVLTGGWAVVGSQAAIAEYKDGRALEYTLKEYMADAGQDDLLARSRASAVSYFSFSEADDSVKDIFTKSFVKSFAGLYEDAEFCPLVLTVSHSKKGLSVNADLWKLSLQKTKAPAFERDTVVTVPSGPFEVKNSGTGKMNRFYQNSHLSLCLNEDGKDLWGIPFKKPICGTAQNVDYYANGKLQIAFGAGSEIYLIDRLGRYVSGFPVNLGKEILIGPDVYDFNGTRKYNIMVLHKDNTVEMYNLKGQKPASWKGIRPSETVKALPERMVVSGSTFWVVRTSIQTLIYPFYGGDPLTAFSGNEMIRPDSEVKPLEGGAVDVLCYDGRHRTVQLK